MTAGAERAPFLTRDTLIAAGALVLASALAWVWLLRADTGGMQAMDGMGMGMSMTAMAWTPTYALTVLVMWAIMMVAMMLPSAASMILLYARVAGGQGTAGVLPPTFVFAGAYVAVWAAFSALATGLQWVLAENGLIGETMRLHDQAIGGALLIGAGLFQLTPLKRICLEKCRGPIAFLTRYWRPGLWGAINLGLRHGAYCVGCCAFIMLLLFVGGVMNLVWVVAIAAFVLAEKLLPFGRRFGLAAGALAILAGASLIAADFA